MIWKADWEGPMRCIDATAPSYTYRDRPKAHHTFRRIKKGILDIMNLLMIPIHCDSHPYVKFSNITFLTPVLEELPRFSNDEAVRE